MSPLLIALIVLFLIGAGIAAYALTLKRPLPSETHAPPPPETAPISPEVLWVHEAGAEFAGLPESARCDLIFAVGTLEDERSRRLLLHALDDPSATVALAAAHALARSGRIDEVREYAQAHHGPRSAELLQLVSLLT